MIAIKDRGWPFDQPSTLPPTEWLHKWYGEGTGFQDSVLNLLNDWGICGRSNDIYNRIILQSILDILLVRVNESGDMEYHPDLSIRLTTGPTLSRRIQGLHVDLVAKGSEEPIRSFWVEPNPHNGLWLIEV